MEKEAPHGAAEKGKRRAALLTLHTESFWTAYEQKAGHSLFWKHKRVASVCLVIGFAKSKTQ